MKIFSRKDAGLAGEDAALAYLRQSGLKLVERNYRCKAGEIDLVMLDGEILALIEVRYRGNSDFGGAAASVTPAKQRKLLNTAGFLMVKRAELRRYRMRFDVVAINPSTPHIEWIKDAFRS